MVLRTPQQAKVEAGRQSTITHVPRKPLGKETEKESNGPGTPHDVKKESHVSTKAQDVAELKDYVGGPSQFQA